MFNRIMMARGINSGFRIILIMALIACVAIAGAVGTREASANPGTVDLVIDADPDTAGIQNTITVEKGAQFTVVVWVQPQDEQEVSVVDAYVDFNASYLSVDETSYDNFQNIMPHANTLFGNPVSRSKDNTSGYADYSDGTGFGAENPTTEFPMFYIKFNADSITSLSGTPISLHSAIPRETDAFLAGVAKTGSLTGITVKVMETPTVNFTTDPANGNITAGESVSFTAVTSSGGPVESWAWDFNNDSTIDSTSANPTWSYGNVAGTYTVKLTGTNTIGSDSETKTSVITVSPDTASKLACTTQPASAGTVDDNFTTQPVLQILDQYNNLCTSDTSTVALAAVLASDDTTAGTGNLTGTSSLAAVGGVATFTNIGYTKLDTVHIKATSGSLTPAVSTTDITLTVGADNKLAYNPAPAASVTAGATWAEFKVDILDQYDNPTTSTATVTVTPSSGAFVSGTASQAAVAGVATFDDLTYTTARTITVTASSGTLTSATSGNITVNASVTTSTSSTGGGGGGGGGSAGVTNVTESVTTSGRFVEDVTAESGGGEVELSIPEDTIGLNRVGQPLHNITIEETAAPSAPPADSQTIGLVYDLGPSGATFDPPISLTFTYDESEIPAGAAEENLVIATWVDGEWVELEGSTVDPDNNTITAPVSHFSIFTVIAHASPAAFEISAFDISPAVANPDESVTISATVTNTGDLAGSYEVTLTINEGVTAVEEVSLAGHASQQVAFSLKPHNTGSYEIDVNGLAGTFIVRESPTHPEEGQPPPEELEAPSEAPSAEAPTEPSITLPTSPEVSPTPQAESQPSQMNLWLIIGIAAGVIVIGTVIWQVTRRRAAKTS